MNRSLIRLFWGLAFLFSHESIGSPDFGPLIEQSIQTIAQSAKHKGASSCDEVPVAMSVDDVVRLVDQVIPEGLIDELKKLHFGKVEQEAVPDPSYTLQQKQRIERSNEALREVFLPDQDYAVSQVLETLGEGHRQVGDRLNLIRSFRHRKDVLYSQHFQDDRELHPLGDWIALYALKELLPSVERSGCTPEFADRFRGKILYEMAQVLGHIIDGLNRTVQPGENGQALVRFPSYIFPTYEPQKVDGRTVLQWDKTTYPLDMRNVIYVALSLLQQSVVSTPEKNLKENPARSRMLELLFGNPNLTKTPEAQTIETVLAFKKQGQTHADLIKEMAKATPEMTEVDQEIKSHPAKEQASKTFQETKQALRKQIQELRKTLKHKDKPETEKEQAKAKIREKEAEIRRAEADFERQKYGLKSLQAKLGRLKDDQINIIPPTYQTYLSPDALRAFKDLRIPDRHREAFKTLLDNYQSDSRPNFTIEAKRNLVVEKGFETLCRM